MGRILIVGATSAIAHEVAKCFAAAGADLFLVGRAEAKLQAVRADLQVRGTGQVHTMRMDAVEFERHPKVVDAAVQALGGLDGVLIAYGTLPDQRRCEASVDETLRSLEVNCLSVISLLTILANYFEEQRRGRIAVITSVAGDRGRQSNYVYGTAKGALNVFLEGLRNRLHRAGVSVVTVKPGFVDTPMTAALKKNALYADAETVGRKIFQAMQSGRDVVYTPWYWRPIMAGVRGVPEAIFKRLRL